MVEEERRSPRWRQRAVFLAHGRLGRVYFVERRGRSTAKPQLDGRHSRDSKGT